MSAPRPTPPPVFSITIIPFAAAVGYVSIAAPFWLGERGVSLAAVGVMSGIAMAPHALKALWAPVLDIGSHRRLWFVGTTAASGALLAALALLPAPERHMGLFTAMAFAANFAATTACAAADGLMAITTAPGRKGSAAAWRMAGNVGGTSVLGGALVAIAARTSVPFAGAALGILVAVTAAAALLVHEPADQDGRRAGESAGRAAARKLGEVLRDVWEMARSREGWTALVICAVPVGAGALTNLFSAMAPAYGASADRVAAVNGWWGGAAAVVGSFAGGWLADHMNRRLAYALSGAVTAATALAMMAGPLDATTYTWGTLAYNFANGIEFSTLAAFVLDIVGKGAAATKYTLFIAVANLAGSYVTTLDGWASEIRALGVRGTLAADVVLTAIGEVVLLGMVWWLRSAPRRAAAAPQARAS